jgi:Amt family ammonium transporter
MHWTWDAGVLAHGSDHAQVAGIKTGVVDSAGGLAVFVAVGVSGLVASRGTRRSKKAAPTSNKRNDWGRSFVAFAGTWLFFVGMCGLVGRSNTTGHGQASVAVMNMILAAGASCLGWCAVESLRQTIYRTWPPRSMEVQGRSATNAVVAGVATIASGAVYLDIPWVVCAAFVAGVCAALPGMRAGQGDLGARALFAAIAIGGSIGVVMTGIFATRDVAGPSLAGGRLGVLENGPLLSQHLAALVLVWLYAGVVSYVLAKLVQLLSRTPATPVSAAE